MMQKNKKPSGQRVGKSKAGKANNQRNRIVEKRKRVPGFHGPRPSRVVIVG